MAPSRPLLRVHKKPLARLRIPMIKRVQTKSLFEEYYYGFLLVFSLSVIVLLKAGGLKTYGAVVGGLWIGAIAFFVTQVIQYFKHRANPEAQARPVAGTAPVEKKTAQEAAQKSKQKTPAARPLPDVKDAGAIKLVPKPGQKPQPPIITGTARPSPFIKPPK